MALVASEQMLAVAQALHRFNAPRVANDVQQWDEISAGEQSRWVKQARVALEAAARFERSEAVTPGPEAA